MAIEVLHVLVEEPSMEVALLALADGTIDVPAVADAVGSVGIDDAYAARAPEGIGAEIIGGNKAFHTSFFPCFRQCRQ